MIMGTVIKSQCEAIWKKCLVALEGSTIELQQVPTNLSVAAMLPHPSMNDTPSHSEQNTVLPYPVHFFHALIFHFRKQIIIWRMYGVIAEVFDHSLDHSDTWKPFAFYHESICLLRWSLIIWAGICFHDNSTMTKSRDHRVKILHRIYKKNISSAMSQLTQSTT